MEDVKILKTISLRVSALLAAAIMVCVVFAPVVSASAELDKKSLNLADQVQKENIPEIEIIENTKTSVILEVGDVCISFKSNPELTEAVMEIEDLSKNGKNKKKDKVNVRYEVSKDSNKFKTNVYYEDDLYDTYITDYNPLAPGSAEEGIRCSTGSAICENDASLTATISSYNYRWDGVYFADGYGIKYPHPDYYAYRIEPWESCYINGYDLRHYHISYSISNTISNMPAVVAGAAIGAILSEMNPVGAIAGAALGLILGNAYCAILLDEEGCIWCWESYDWGWTIVPVPPFVEYLPEYFRISAYTLWDDLGLGTP